VRISAPLIALRPNLAFGASDKGGEYSGVGSRPGNVLGAGAVGSVEVPLVGVPDTGRPSVGIVRDTSIPAAKLEVEQQGLPDAVGIGHGQGLPMHATRIGGSGSASPISVPQRPVIAG
jgi:hypothetical protein